jgi:hypothetical protein
LSRRRTADATDDDEAVQVDETDEPSIFPIMG